MGCVVCEAHKKAEGVEGGEHHKQRIWHSLSLNHNDPVKNNSDKMEEQEATDRIQRATGAQEEEKRSASVNHDVQYTAQTKTASATTTSTDTLPTLENEVKQLVGNVSSWWSGFSKRSQDQIKEVRAQIDAQGGLVSIAKREAQKLEEQLTEAQKAARQEARVSSEDQIESSTLNMDGWGTVGSIGASSTTASNSLSDIEGSKGKARQREGDEGAVVERLEERANERRSTGAGGLRADAPKLTTAEGEALFDADAGSDAEVEAHRGDVNTLPSRPSSEFKVIDEAIAATQKNAQSAMNSMQSFWKQLQADPRLTNMQASVAHTLQNMSLVTPGSEEPHEKTSALESNADPTQSPQKRASVILPDLSKKFQESFPQLDLKESQAMAKRYLEASQNAARDWGKEMGHLVSDLVHIVPPEAHHDATSGLERAASIPGAGTGSAAAVANASQPRRSTSEISAPLHAGGHEEDDFDWDNDLDGTSSGGLETTTGPPTTSWEGSTSDTNLASHVQGLSDVEDGSTPLPNRTAETGRSNVSAVPGVSHQVRRDDGDDEDDDSDWE